MTPRTPGGGLVTLLKKKEYEINMFSSQRVKIVEEGGVTLESLLVRSDPNKEINCVRDKCQICQGSVLC